MVESPFNNLFHVGSFGSDDPPGDLKIFLVVNLYIIPTGQFALFVVVAAR